MASLQTHNHFIACKTCQEFNVGVSLTKIKAYKERRRKQQGERDGKVLLLLFKYFLYFIKVRKCIKTTIRK